MAKYWMTNDTYDARAAGLLKLAVHIKIPSKQISTMIQSNRPLRALIQ
jgi:hypothetical protein